jgi:hypothetical protein
MSSVEDRKYGSEAVVAVDPPTWEIWPNSSGTMQK